ncbi:MAG: hypothetical protein SFW09_15605 [Hyphomicrobiaceae bacterium]|nr:hypothetical protein [Hyphomicrobiaceae bacterium]
MSTTAVGEFLAAVAERQDAEAVASAFAAHLAQLTSANLPPLAQSAWRSIARLLKAPAERPIPERAILAVRSWPAARLDELLAHAREIQVVLEKLDNERLEDEIRDEIRRHYL